MRGLLADLSALFERLGCYETAAAGSGLTAISRPDVERGRALLVFRRCPLMKRSALQGCDVSDHRRRGSTSRWEKDALAPMAEFGTAIAHLRNVLVEAADESLVRKGEAMTTAEMATYAYDQIDRARTELTAVWK